MKIALVVTAQLSIVAVSFYCGHEFDNLLAHFLRGEARYAIAKKTIQIGGAASDAAAAVKTTPPCDRKPMGGILAGTPVEIRTAGPFHRVKLSFELATYDRDFELIDADEGRRLTKKLKCEPE